LVAKALLPRKDENTNQRKPDTKNLEGKTLSGAVKGGGEGGYGLVRVRMSKKKK